METFTTIKALANNPHFQTERRVALACLSEDMIDAPIVDIINNFNARPCCYTLQCCFGHFLYAGQDDENNLDPLPITNRIDTVEYRIAYIAFCVENSSDGKTFLAALKGLTEIDPENIQLGSAEWFWQQQVNSYAIQVEPDRFKYQDTAIIEYAEALSIERIRNQFYKTLKELLCHL
jgi:hypothetical protein